MVEHNPNLIVISGGPGSGKTTVIEYLRTLGHHAAPEVARQIIQEQVQLDEAALPWREREAYTRLMLERSIESYKTYSSQPGPVFFDRGIPDTLGYAQLIGLADDSFIRDACRLYRYAPVAFLAPPWPEIYATDTERKQDLAEAIRTFEILAETYRECGYEVRELPRSTPSARAEFILHAVRPSAD
ncbi:MAG TPA: AAA family ATPase [Terriglobales bacterium]|nr:AAA family ATPase [Terriglobales bacterium]